MKEEIKTPERPPRPKSLNELFKLVKKTCPNAAHNEEAFLGSVLEQLEKDPIRNRTLISEVGKQGMDLPFQSNQPLNDFWYAAYDYLIKNRAQGREINKLQAIVRDGFVS